MTSNYMEHGFCLNWERSLVALHVGSDLITGIAYYSIPIAMFYFAYRRRDIPFIKIFIMFALFIFSCGTTHFFSAYTIYRPDYWIEGYVKAITAVISATAAIIFIPRIPDAIAFPSVIESLEENKKLILELGAKNAELQMANFSIEKVFDQVYWISEDARICRVNEAACKSLGYTTEEMLEFTIADLDPHFPLQHWSDHWSELKAKGSLTLETQHRAKDGSLMDVEVSANYIFYEGQEFICAIIRDITKRKQAETKLKESEYLFRESQRAAFTGSYKADFIAGYWESSEVLDTIFGIDGKYDRSIQGWLDLVHPDDRNMLDQYLREEVIAKGEPFTKEYRIIRKSDGETRWVHASGEVIFNNNSNSSSLIGTIRDVTERHRDFEHLENISRRLQLATASANLGVWDWNVRDNHMDWDDRMFELYGITRETFPNSVDAWMYGLHPEDREAAVAALQAALNGEQAFDITFRVRHPDGTVKHIKANGLVVRGKDGTAERMIGVNADITDKELAEQWRVKLEAQLRQAQKMESVGRLAGGVAHDFNNMLTIILGHVQIALMDANLSQPLHAQLEEINNAAERSANLTRQLLAFARKQIITPKVLDLNRTVAGMLKMLERLIGEDIHLVWHPAANLWPVKMDSSQIDQILANLCVNARDAIADVGKITIETGNIVFDKDYCATHLGFIPGEYARLAVSDNGCGMDKETLGNIFEPFFTTKGSGEGTGLGLAMVYGIVKQNNGFINVYSEPNQGTTLTIYLPRFEGNVEQTDKHGASETVTYGHEIILLVEDEPAILKITTQMLEMRGYTVLATSTPGEAIRLAREHAGEIHLLMTDVIMPEMNGRDLAKNLLSSYPHLKQLFMSGYTANVIAHHGVLDEGVYFIQKPFSLEGLSAKLREVLNDK
jgi:PAS domain S-box-containing protein